MAKAPNKSSKEIMYASINKHNWSDFRFSFGSIVRDKVSGFIGVVMGRSDYSTGCKTVGVAPQKLDKEGKLITWEWFDEERLELIKNKKPIIFNSVLTEPVRFSFGIGGPDMPRQEKK